MGEYLINCNSCQNIDKNEWEFKIGPVKKARDNAGPNYVAYDFHFIGDLFDKGIYFISRIWAQFYIIDVSK